jgi:hypothetical protein
LTLGEPPVSKSEKVYGPAGPLRLMIAGLPVAERFPPAPVTVRVLVPVPVPVTVSDGGVVQTTVSVTVAGGGGVTTIVDDGIVDSGGGVVVVVGGGEVVVVVVVGVGGTADCFGDELGESRVDTRTPTATATIARAGRMNRRWSLQTHQPSVWVQDRSRMSGPPAGSRLGDDPVTVMAHDP